MAKRRMQIDYNWRMADVFFTDSSEAPVPPEEVRIRSLEAEPRADGRRISVRTALTPFQQRPNLELSIRNEGGDQVASLSVVEAIDAQMDFTMHLREAQTGGRYTLSMRVFYADIEGHEAGEAQAVDSADLLERAAMVVDEDQVEFQIPHEEN